MPTTAASPTERPVAGMAAALGGIVLWGSLVVLVKVGDDTNGLVIGFHRIWIGALGVGIVAAVLGQFPTRHALRVSLLGGLLFAADIVLFFSAIKLTTVANATIVGALQPVILLSIASRQFGERITRSLIATTAIAIGGAVLVAIGSAESIGEWNLFGDLLAVGALLSWSGYFAASKKARQTLPTIQYLASFLLIATVAVAPFAVAFGGGLAVDDQTWVIVVVLALGSGAIGHFLMNWSHSHIPLSLTSLLTLSLPAVSAISAALFVDEPLVALQVVGITIVILSLGVVVRRVEPPTDTPLGTVEPA